MAKLSEVQVIERSLKQWRDMAETGEPFTHDWKGWKKNGGRYKSVWNDCFLCEYTWMLMGRHSCTFCPFFKKFEYVCEDLRSPYSHWIHAEYDKDRRVAAQECVEVLEQLLEEAKNECAR